MVFYCSNRGRRGTGLRVLAFRACLAQGLQFVRRARVLPSPCPATRNLCVLEVSPAPSPCCFNSLLLAPGNQARQAHVNVVTGMHYTKTEQNRYTDASIG
jgi:hypothetical protein